MSKGTTDALRERLAFEELITELSTRFVSVTGDNLDSELNDALGAIGEFSKVDRVYIFRFTADGRAMDNSHEWCAEGVEPQIQNLQALPLEVLPWWSQQLKAREVIHVPDVATMGPEAAAEQQLLIEQSVQSVLAIPMICEDKVVGFVGYDSVKVAKAWPKTDIALLRIAGEIFTSAIERARAERERKHLETQLIQARSLENVARLAGGVAHDFNNLIGIILNYAALLRREIVDPEQRKRLDELFGAAERAAQLTRQLLLVGRRDIVEPVLLDLGDVVRSLRGLLEQTVGDNIALHLEIAPDLEMVRVGLPQVEQVIVNLTLNARDAMPRGGNLRVELQNAEITAEYARRYIDLVPGCYVRLRIVDDGIGMTADVHARAFEPFFTTKGPVGTGLGLSSVHGIVEQAGGHVVLSTELGTGTIADVYFPVAAIPAASRPPPPPPASSPKGREETVLVVDDSASLRRVVSVLLRANRYRTLEASTPEEAFAVCEEHAAAIDLLLTDVIMPQMSGRDLAARLRDDYGITNVLYMSGYSDEIIAHHGVLHEGTHLLQKPFLEKDLLRAVRAVLDAQARREGFVSA